MKKQNSVVNSSLWAAYADALGFISELTDASGLKRRLKGRSFNTTCPWVRKIGGPYGVFINLPAGCYSDDTQLRLSTMRSIRGTGEFDVEVFAKIELPVWLCYDLGAGPTTKAAASALSNRNANWFSNFFKKAGFKKKLNYVNGGGNGAVMRIQPHIWAAKSLANPEVFLGDVFRNTICTHGHPRAIMGSIFHAFCLAHVLAHDEIPGPIEWMEYANDLQIIEKLVESDSDLQTFWLPAWEKENGVSFSEACLITQLEMKADIDIIASIPVRSAAENYDEAVKLLGALTAEWRGTGTKTALLAAALSWFFRKDEIELALLHCASVIGSDTDTIGTVAGAILGAIQQHEPEGEILDREYIRKESIRLARIGDGDNAGSFAYPDMLNWKPPKSSLDCIGITDDGVALAGLGHISFSGDIYKGGSKTASSWEWGVLDFGQTVLCARRNKVVKMLPGNHPAKQAMGEVVMEVDGSKYKRPTVFKSKPYSEEGSRKIVGAEGGDLFEDHLPLVSQPSVVERKAKVSVDQLTDDVIRAGFTPGMIGQHLRKIFDDESAIELAAGYAAILAKAWRARQKRSNDKQ